MNERRILLAEPDPAHAATLTELLQAMHYTVEHVSSGIVALQRLQDADTPEMALLSSRLPLMNGMEVAMEIRRRSRRRQLWLMLMSGTPSAEEVAMATDAGIDEFMVKPVSASELRMRIRTGERVQSVYREITDAAAALEFHATHDPLTGVWRREAMLDLLFQETDRSQRLRTPLSLLQLDLDRFTDFNLRYGYSLGDKLLPALCNRLRNQLRSYDMVGRIGEDEFLIALPGCIAADALRQGERLRLSLARRPFTINGSDLHITASFGVAESSGRSPLIVLREAERGLALAKSQGRNCVRGFSPVADEMQTSPQSRRKSVAQSQA